MIPFIIKLLKIILLREFGNKTLNVNDVHLMIEASDPGGKHYKTKGSYEELSNPLYAEISSEFNPTLTIDVGANYGFTGIVFARAFPSSKVILIEPSGKLCRYINYNFKLNNISNFEVIHAICGSFSCKQMTFSINPMNSQDNRVIAESSDWHTEIVPTITLNDVIQQHFREGFIFIKIDTQGYEEYVFRGSSFLYEHSNWIIKTEFAPYWLRSQGTNPVAFLKKLTETFQVVELPVRTRYRDSLKNLNKLHQSDVSEFINYIQSLDANNRGWCDLLIHS